MLCLATWKKAPHFLGCLLGSPKPPRRRLFIVTTSGALKIDIEKAPWRAALFKPGS